MSFRLYGAPTNASPQVRARGLDSSPEAVPSVCRDTSQSLTLDPTDRAHPDTLLPRVAIGIPGWTEADVRTAQEVVVKLEAILELVRAEERKALHRDELDAALHDLFCSDHSRARLEYDFEGPR